MIDFFKGFFIWWNKRTFGTQLYTFFRGKYVDKDEFGNKYYENSSGKRWVIYNKEVEASKIPPEWYSWIHFISDKKPLNNSSKYFWQKKYSENLTGTEKAYRPEGSIKLNKIQNKKKYETWNN